MNDIENYVSWNITDLCNFNCEYCFSRQGIDTTQKFINRLALIIKKKYLKRGGKSNLNKAERLVEILRRTKKNWVIGLTGGEPMVLPEFIDICKILTKHYQIGLITNLSFPGKVKIFTENIRPDKVKFISISAHIPERKGRIDEFIDSIKLLKENKYNINITYVLYPPLINQFKRHRDLFKREGLDLIPKPFKGKYNELNYPDHYDDMVKKLMKKNNPEINLVLPFGFKGLKCNAGKNYMKIYSNGEVVRCEDHKLKLGSIMEGINFLEKPIRCNAESCSCLGIRMIDKSESKKLGNRIKW